MPSPLILASQSPRRRELLAQAGYPFDVLVPDEDAEDAIRSGETPADLVVRLARQKAENVAARVAEGTVVGCDTVAFCDDLILGKPTDIADARRMLRHLRGREHQVLSGLCLCRRPGGESRTGLATTTLVMDSVSDEDLESYLQTGKWLGKAGAFGYQDGHDWLHVVCGSESCVVGLPLELLGELLAEFSPADGRP